MSRPLLERISLQAAARRKSLSGLPVLLSRRNVFLFPTRAGGLFLTLMTAMLVGSINYNNNLGLLLTFLLGGMFFIALFQTHAMVSGLLFTRVDAPPVFAGQETPVTLYLLHTRRDVVGLTCSLGDAAPVVVRARAHASIRTQLRLPAPQRGVLPLPPLLLESVYPLGLVRAWTWITLPARRVVWPSPLSHGKTGSALFRDMSEGRMASSRGTEFQGVRTYRPGDPLTRIAWKSSTKGQGLLTKDFEEPEGAALLIDYAAIDLPDPEKRLQAMSSLAVEADHQGRAFALRLPGVSVPPGRGPAHLDRCLTLLAEM